MTQWRNRITERRQMKIGELDKNKFNPKTHPDNQKRRLDAILNKFGQVGEIYAWHSERNNGNLTIFDGNGRHSLDPDQTWDIAITDLTDAEVDELVLMYDPVAQLAQIDIPQAMSLMTDIHEPDPVLDGFLSDIAAEAGFQRDGGKLEDKEDLTGKDKIPEDNGLVDKWGVRPGQLWELGRHRVICGDCTDKGVVGRLLGDDRAVLVMADPPYGMGKEKDGVANDNLYREKLDAFQMLWWSVCRAFVEDNGSCYIWGNAPDLWRLWYKGGLRIANG